MFEENPLVIIGVLKSNDWDPKISTNTFFAKVSEFRKFINISMNSDEEETGIIVIELT